MHGGPTAIFEIQSIADLIEKGQIIVTFSPRPDGELALSGRVGLTEAQIVALNRRLHYVQEITQRAPDACGSQTAITAHIGEVAALIGDQDPPGASTIAAWIKKWHASGRQDGALAARPKPSRKDFSHIDAKVLAIVDEAIRELWLNRQRRTMRAVHADVLRRIANHNVRAKDSLTPPSEHTIRSIIKAIDRYESDRERHGSAYAARKHRAAGRIHTADAPLEICMADGQYMDVFVCYRNEDGSPGEARGRPYLTAVLDLRTRCILAALVTMQPFCGATALKAMMTAVTAESGKPRGIMTTLIVDNGCDFRDSGFQRFLRELDITLEVCGPRSPNGKANVERFFRTINEGLIHTLPGTTFSNPMMRGDYRSQDLANITLEDLQQKVEDWIHNVYHKRPHRALGRAPIDVWNAEAAS